MKKIIAVVFLFSSFMLHSVKAELGLNVGLSGSLAVFHATGTENENGETSSDDATGVAGYGSIFIEKSFGDRLLVGIDYVPSSLESETSETVVDDLKGAADGASAQQTNKVQVDFEDLTTFYLGLNVTESLYVKAGMVQVDVITNESLGTGSTYGNASLDGTMFGLGYNHSYGNGISARIEGSYMDFDDASVTASNTDNTISLKGLEGASAKISLVKSF
jgi:hypothetical protein